MHHHVVNSAFVLAETAVEPLWKVFTFIMFSKYPKNSLFNSENRSTGVKDQGISHISHPPFRTELSVACAMLVIGENELYSANVPGPQAMLTRTQHKNEVQDVIRSVQNEELSLSANHVAVDSKSAQISGQNYVIKLYLR